MLEEVIPAVKCCALSPDGKCGVFSVEPLEQGHGITLGNSLRRVLYSFLKGYAAVSVKIDGVLHEFSTIPGVKEDVTEIILNIKGIVFKSFSDEFKTVTLEHKGKGVLTAQNIKLDSEVEILNPEIHIATLNEDANFRMEIVIGPGHGYVSFEKNKIHTKDTIGVIPVDSLYNPVRKVSYNIENTRVGNITDYDRLIIEVCTNGVITPQDALDQAAQIMIEHFKLFLSIQTQDTAYSNSMEINQKYNEYKKNFELSIEEMEFSARAYNCLKRAGIHTVKDLISKSEVEMKQVRNLGAKSLEEVETKLKDLGLSLAASG